MLIKALRAANVRSSPSCVPSSRMGIPIVAIKLRGAAHSGAAKYPGCAKRGQRIWWRAASCMQAETHHGGGAHLNGRDAAFGVTLGKMPVTRRVEAPSTLTGISRREPLVSCLASTLPQLRGGSVRRPSSAMGPRGGTASCGSGRNAMPPRYERRLTARPGLELGA